jgi:hypothetical protein
MSESNQIISENEKTSPVYDVFLKQFAENQNHHQKLFIQFLSSVAIVIAAYAFVYTNTIGYSGITVGSKLMKPELFTSIKTEDGSILSYGLIHLVIIYLFAQIILFILLCIILHMGYSYRRDQVVIYRIQHKLLGEKDFEATFGKASYNGLQKSIIDYLPNFNSILFFALFIIQGLMFMSVYVYFNNCPQDQIFFKNIFNNNVTFFHTKLSLCAPVALTLLAYIAYFYKYNKRVSKAELYQKLEPTSEVIRKFWFTLSLIAFSLSVLFITFYLVTDSTIFLSLSLTHVCFTFNFVATRYLMLKNKTHPLLQNVGLGISFCVIGGIIVYKAIHGLALRTEFHNLGLGNIVLGSYSLLLIFVLLIAEKVNQVSSKATLLINQINLEIILIFLSAGSMLIMYTTGLKWVDKGCSFVMGFLFLVLGFRWFSAALNSHFHSQT